MTHAPDHGDKLARSPLDVPVQGRNLATRIVSDHEGNPLLVFHHPEHGVVARRWLTVPTEDALDSALAEGLSVAERNAAEATQHLVDSLHLMFTQEVRGYRAILAAGLAYARSGNLTAFREQIRDTVVVPSLRAMDKYRRDNDEPAVARTTDIVEALQAEMERDAIERARDHAQHESPRAETPVMPEPPSTPTMSPRRRGASAPHPADSGPRGKSRVHTLDPDVKAVLASARIDDMAVHLPDTRLDPALYKRIKKALEAVGAPWSRSSQAHVFQRDDAREAFLAMLGRGSYVTTKDIAFFPTPPALAAEIARLVGATRGRLILEPSAGNGSIVRALLDAGANVVAVEYDPGRAAELARLAASRPGLRVLQGDFLRFSVDDLGGPFDGVAMNPPFSLAGQPAADVEHVQHALAMARKGAPVVAVMSPGARDRSSDLHRGFRRRAAAGGARWRDLPAGTFADVGTDAGSVLLTMIA